MTNPQESVLVDTDIWYYAYVTPKEPEFVAIHNNALGFLSDLLEDETISLALTTYQICEILELFRKSGVDIEERRKLTVDFFSGDFYVKEIVVSEVKACLSKSISSDIHIYDYLVALPLRGIEALGIGARA